MQAGVKKISRNHVEFVLNTNSNNVWVKGEKHGKTAVDGIINQHISINEYKWEGGTWKVIPQLVVS